MQQNHKAYNPRFLLLFFLVCMTLRLSAQIPDEPVQRIDTIRSFIYYNTPGFLHEPTLMLVDTSLLDFHHYEPLSVTQKLFATMGNTGQAYYPLVLKNIRILSEINRDNPFDAYRITPDNIPYYQSNVPVTNLFYVTGSNKEQVFNGEMYQQVRKFLGLGARFKIINSMGAYTRQKTDNVSYAFQAMYHHPSGRYAAVANMISNRYRPFENGGLLDPSPFEENTETDRRRILTRLIKAETRQKEAIAYLQQSFKLLKKQTESATDTLHYHRNVILEKANITHSLHFTRLSHVYEDFNPQSGFYKNVFTDSAETLDSVMTRQLDNRISLTATLATSGSIRLNFSGEVLHRLIGYHLSEAKSTYSVVAPLLSADLAISKKYRAGLRYEHVFGNLNAGDKDLLLYAEYGDHQSNKPALNLSWNLTEAGPSLFHQHYTSNHFFWDNTFAKQHSINWDLNLSVKNNRLGLVARILDGMLYLDEEALPAQHEPGVNYLAAYLDSKIRWKNVQLSNYVALQRLGQDAPVDLPLLAIRSSIAFDLTLFKGALQTHSGIELRYNTQWYAPSYMPALRSFYTQPLILTGNYLYADVFLNMRIKRARLFLLLQHANQGLMGYTYYMIPGYPMADRVFKFGVSWMFFD